MRANMNKCTRREFPDEPNSHTLQNFQRHCDISGRPRRLSRLPAKTRTSRLMRTQWAACLAAASLLALSGCTAIKVKLGMRVYLDKTPVSAMQASLYKGPAIAPGEKLPLVAQFTQPDGKVLVTEGQGKGKVLWSDLVVTPTVVTADKKGNVSLAHDPRKSDGK